MKYSIGFVAIALFVALPSLAVAQEPAHDHDAMQSAEGGANTEADKAMMDAHMKMMKDMDMKPTGDPDKDFVTMMIPHHQGAVDMAKVQLKYGKDPELKALAEKIIADQEKEIAQMRAWRERPWPYQIVARAYLRWVCPHNGPRLHVQRPSQVLAGPHGYDAMEREEHAAFHQKRAVRFFRERRFDTETHITPTASPMLPKKRAGVSPQRNALAK